MHLYILTNYWAEHSSEQHPYTSYKYISGVWEQLRSSSVTNEKGEEQSFKKTPSSWAWTPALILKIFGLQVAHPEYLSSVLNPEPERTLTDKSALFLIFLF